MARPALRRASAIIATSALMAAPAVAGDRALIDFIGFSGDGRYFALEEFGVQDGSGFPYSSIYAVDLSTDKWVKGSPFRVMLEEENATLARARRNAQETAAAALADLDVSAPAHVIAMNADGEPGDGLSLTFGRPGSMPGEVAGQHELTLAMSPAGSPEPCEDYLGEKAKGFTLTLSEGNDATVLHDDGGTLPASRGCATTYRIYAVVTPEYGEVSMGAAIISVYPYGFEGPDRRFIAVPLKVPGP